MAVNINETWSIHFSRLKKESQDKYKTAFKNTNLGWSNHCNCLGVILDQDPFSNNTLPIRVINYKSLEVNYTPS